MECNPGDQCEQSLALDPTVVLCPAPPKWGTYFFLGGSKVWNNLWIEISGVPRMDL